MTYNPHAPSGNLSGNLSGNPSLDPGGNSQMVGLLQDEPLSFDYPDAGECGVKLPDPGVPAVDPAQSMAGAVLRQDNLGDLPALSEFETVRHFTRLSRYNYSIDAGMYPLGSCTMKYNPRINETVARMDGFTQVHPLLPDALVQGTLALLYRLEEALKEITGFPAVSLQPAAGAQGELTGVLLIRARLDDKGEHRRYMLVTDSAHGTNPSSAHIAGFQVREVNSGEGGRVDLASLEAAMDEDVAGLMLTNPNTLGIFEHEILRIAEIVHAKGGYIYCDGANMNAQVGITRPADYGMDVLHLNLHKTFATPHGGGGPGAGPCFCVDELAPYLPQPRIVKKGETYHLDPQPGKSIGKVSTFNGNANILVRAFSYIAAMGGDGLKEMSETAVLNANYLRHHLQEVLTLSQESPTLHEVVFSDHGLHEHGNITTMDLTKRLMDYGFHPPTVYFPLTVPGALMIEPTESEPRAELDRFVGAVKAILEEADTDPELVKSAPHLVPRRRLDEVRAARQPILRWHPPSE